MQNYLLSPPPCCSPLPGDGITIPAPCPWDNPLVASRNIETMFKAAGLSWLQFPKTYSLFKKQTVFQLLHKIINKIGNGCQENANFKLCWGKELAQVWDQISSCKRESSVQKCTQDLPSGRNPLWSHIADPMVSEGVCTGIGEGSSHICKRSKEEKCYVRAGNWQRRLLFKKIK